MPPSSLDFQSQENLDGRSEARRSLICYRPSRIEARSGFTLSNIANGRDQRYLSALWLRFPGFPVVDRLLAHTKETPAILSAEPEAAAH